MQHGEPGVKTVCPKCGLRGTVIARRRGDRVYYYVRHRLGGRVVEHYAGPEEYVYVTKMHEDLGLYLRGPLKLERVVDYLDALVTRLTIMVDNIAVSLSEEEEEDLHESVRRVLERLRDRLPVWTAQLERLRGAVAPLLTERREEQQGGRQG